MAPVSYRSWRRTVGAALVVAGAGLVAFVIVSLLDRQAAQRDARAVLKLAPLEDAADLSELHPDEGVAARERPSSRPKPGSVVGRIRIESAGIDVMALEGIGSGILRKAAGHFPGTALPGTAGNASFAAHRDSFFRGLRHVGVDDLIHVETGDGTFLYRVSETRVVEPEAVEVVDSRGRSELTLVTCYPFDYIGPAPRRFVVHADLVGSTG